MYEVVSHTLYTMHPDLRANLLVFEEVTTVVHRRIQLEQYR